MFHTVVASRRSRCQKHPSRLLVMIIGGCLLGSCTGPAAPLTTSSSTTATSAAPTSLSLTSLSLTSHPPATVAPTSAAAILARSGIATVMDEDDRSPVVPLTPPIVDMPVTAWQAAQMDAEIAAGTGILGGDLDQAVPLPGDAPPLSYVIGAWIANQSGPAAASARTLMGPQDWHHAPDVLFPSLVLRLFVADIVGRLGAASVPPSKLRRPTESITTTGCSTVSDFVNDALRDAFAKLKLDADQVQQWTRGVFGDGTAGDVAAQVAGIFGGFWNSAIEFAHTAVTTTLAGLTAPIVTAVRLALGALAVITTVTSYLKKWRAPVVADPSSERFAIGSEPDRTGRFTVQIDKQAEISDWPTLLVNCAKTFDVPLPSLSKAGLPVQWRVFKATAPVATFAPALPATTPLTAALNSSIGYTTGREDKRTAKGTLVFDRVTVGVYVRRNEIDQLKDFISDFMTHQLPAVAQPVVTPIIKPYLNRVFTFLDTIVGIEGKGVLIVAHHLPPQCRPGPAIPVGSYTAAPTSGPVTVVESRPGTARIAELAKLTALTLSSNGQITSGSLSISWSGSGTITLPGGISAQIAENSSLRNAKISGPVADPVVDGTIVGTESVDGDPTPYSRPVHLHLGATVTCTNGARGDLVGLLRQTVTGSFTQVQGTVSWTAGWDPL